MIAAPDPPLRSLLFAPGNEPRKVAKVASFGADAVILDLEDAVPDAQKVASRDLVRAALGTVAGGPAGPAARAAAFALGAIESSRSRITASAPRLCAPSTNFSTFTGTNIIERHIGSACSSFIPLSSFVIRVRP